MFPSLIAHAKAGARAARSNLLLSPRRQFRHGAERCAPSQNTVLRAAHTGLCADAFWRIAKARTEKPVEVRNIGKASLQCDVANTNIAQVLRRKEHERMFQP